MFAQPAHVVTRKRCLKVAQALVASSFAMLVCTGASAASFSCAHKLSASERIVCQDAQLSALDDKLAVSYRQAKDAAVDPAAIEADRTQQWLWRQHNCKDKACVADWYQRRIAELNADSRHGAKMQHDAFESSLAEQKLAPSAEKAVRELKSPVPEVAAR